MNQLKFYMKYPKLKNVHVIFHPLKYYQDQNLPIQLYNRNNITYDF